MDLRKIKTLIDLVQQSGIDELEISEGEEKVRISRGRLAGPAPAAIAPTHGIVPAAKRNPHYPYAANRAGAQMEAIMQNAQAICGAAGTDLRHALRLMTMHTDLNEYAHAIGARRPCFPDGQPATTTIQVQGPLQVPECSIAVDLWVGYP